MKMFRKRAGAFSLVEVALALGVASFALIAIFGLLPVGLSSNQASIRQTEATDVLSNIISDLRATAPTATTSPRLKLAVPLAGGAAATYSYYLNGDGTVSSALTPISQYLITTRVTPAPSGQRVATVIGIVVSWPATLPLPTPPASPAPTPALVANAPNSVAAFVVLDRN